MILGIPNLFLAGAPKCGTTSLFDWIGQHPAIFAPVVKEPIYFGSDLTSGVARRTEENYRSLYAKRRDEPYAIDGSTHYFYARNAAAEIRKASPEARIVLCLRHPAEAAHSMFHQLRFNGAEMLSDFAMSLAAEPERRQNLVAMRKGFPENLLYSRVFAIRENVSRFLEQFGQNRVMVVLLDDLKAEPRQALSEIFAWLGIAQNLSSQIDLKARNGAKRPRSRFIGDLASYPPSWIGRITAPFASAENRYKLRHILRNLNTAEAVNPALDPALRELLIHRHLDDIAWLEDILGRNLEGWRN